MFRKSLIISGMLALAALIVFAAWVQTLPDIKNLNKHETGLSIKIKDAAGKTRDLAVGIKNPSWTPLNQISPYLLAAVIASEDDAFFQHKGFDLDELKDAIKTDIEKKRFARGASTITMQLAKNLYLTKEKTIVRKLKEAYLTYRIESLLTKNRILELYLNVAEWGPGIYGIGQASEYYFGKKPLELNLKEATLFAVILPSPRYYNPYVRMAKIEKRQNYLLARMLAEHDIQDPEYETALSTPLKLRDEL